MPVLFSRPLQCYLDLSHVCATQWPVVACHLIQFSKSVDFVQFSCLFVIWSLLVQFRSEPRSSYTTFWGFFPKIFPLCGNPSAFKFPGISLFGPPARKLGLNLPHFTVHLLQLCPRLGSSSKRTERKKSPWGFSHPLGTTPLLIGEETSTSSELRVPIGPCCYRCHSQVIPFPRSKPDLRASPEALSVHADLHFQFLGCLEVSLGATGREKKIVNSLPVCTLVLLLNPHASTTLFPSIICSFVYLHFLTSSFSIGLMSYLPLKKYFRFI